MTKTNTGSFIKLNLKLSFYSWTKNLKKFFSKSGCLNFNDIMNAGGSNEMKILNNLKYKLQSSDPINIQYTSGTTGSLA